MAKLSTKNTSGTSFHGQTIYCSYNELVELIGKPQMVDNTGQDKVNFEWDCETKDGTPFTIYDWKEYRVLDLDEEIEWHIGTLHSLSSITASNELDALVREL